jgi:hypothetical protein
VSGIGGRMKRRKSKITRLHIGVLSKKDIKSKLTGIMITSF